MSDLSSIARPVPPPRYLYVFLDEAGNLDFSLHGTRYFLMGAVTQERPFRAHGPLDDLRHDIIEGGLDLEYFHAAEDRQSVRDRVFATMNPHMGSLRFDCVVVEKCKTGPRLQSPEAFYPRMLGYLLRYILDRYHLSDFAEIVVITDRLPVQKKLSVFEKSIKAALVGMLPADARYRLMHHDSKSHYGLQVCDYITWAVYRKWTLQDVRSYGLIQPAIRSEFDIFQTGTVRYY
jgi:hypothetical protein